MMVNPLDFLYITIGLLASPILMRKKRHGWGERFGHVQGMLSDDFTDGSSDRARKRVMLHAVSVGEINALRTLVPMLSVDHRVIVSTTTDTGLAQAQRLYGELNQVEVVRYPLDCSWMVRRFLDYVNPDVVGLVELEVWPNFISQCAKRGIPIGIINGRLSARSYKGYRKARFLLRSTFIKLSFACVQDHAYADRISSMGVDRDLVSVSGSMKWDSVKIEDEFQVSEAALQIAHEMGIDLDQPVVVGGSTGPGEEALLLKAVSDDVQLVIAPRKPERFDEAWGAMGECVRRSSGICGDGRKRFLLDTIGELSTLYQIADLVIIGRSFFDLYGSDPIEPAAMGKPVLIGPMHSDFEQAMGVLIGNDGIQVVDKSELGEEIARFLSSTEIRNGMGERAKKSVRSQMGASQKHCDVLLEHIGSKKI